MFPPPLDGAGRSGPLVGGADRRGPPLGGGANRIGPPLAGADRGGLFLSFCSKDVIAGSEDVRDDWDEIDTLSGAS